jgi:hypothetical protein
MATFAQCEPLRATSPGRPGKHSRDLLAYHEAFEERAAIYEFDAGLPRAEAEMRARRDVRHLLPDFHDGACLDDRGSSAPEAPVNCQRSKDPT